MSLICVQVTHGEIVNFMVGLDTEFTKLRTSCTETREDLEAKLAKSKKGWLQSDKELKQLKYELHKERLRNS